MWRHLTEQQRRHKIIIGVIDDKQLPAKPNLEATGYNIRHLGDPQTIDAVKSCHIILCDLQGVGVAMDPANQGAYFIAEIRKNFPEKFVVAYTGGGLNLSISRQAINISDDFLKKDAQIDEWRETLDPIIDQLLDPAEVWDRQRAAMVDRGIDTLSILKVEDAFVRAVMSRKNVTTDYFSSTISGSKFSGELKPIIQSMIASGLYALLIGA